MKTEITIKYSKDFEKTGCVSQITWHNKDLLQSLSKLFAVRENETLTGLTITEQHITAHFK